MRGALTVGDLKPGDILVTVFDPLCWPHWGISPVIKSPFVHVTLYLGDGAELSADACGIVKRPLTDKYCIVLGSLDERSQFLAAQYSDLYVGKPYNYVGVFLLGIQKLMGKLRWNLIDKNSRFCSELVSDLYVLTGSDVLPWLENGETSPADFLLSELLYIKGIYINKR